MTEDQIEMLRYLIKDEIEAANIDGMEDGAWGWADKNLEESWKKFKKSFDPYNLQLMIEQHPITPPPPNDLSHLSDDEFRALCPQGYHGVGDDRSTVSEGRGPASAALAQPEPEGER